MLNAFHVSSERHLERIDPSVCNDPWRDGLIYGASVVCFTTTTGLGLGSPYPRGANEGSRVHRYTHTFDPLMYDKFQMAQTTVESVQAQTNAVERVTQVHFLLLRKDSARKLVVNVMFWHAVDDIMYDGTDVKTEWLSRLLEALPDEDAHYQRQKAAALRRKMDALFRTECVIRRHEAKRRRLQRKARPAARAKATATPQCPPLGRRSVSLSKRKERRKPHRTLVFHQEKLR